MKQCKAVALLVHSLTKNILQHGFNLTNWLEDAFVKGIPEDWDIEQWNYISKDCSLATIIFTSGSTGVPKAVPHTHKRYSNCLPLLQYDDNMKSTDTILQRTPVTFVLHHQDIFGSFYLGACLVLMRPRSHRDVDYTNDVIYSQHVSLVTVTPTFLNALLDDGANLDKLETLRVVLCTGEYEYKHFEKLILL